jgi:UDPglucose--hexose-1-phosphate uridylyltransferase
MSELRQDIVSGEWVLLAPGRAARPRFLDAKKQKRKPSPKAGCPFENLATVSGKPPLFTYPSGKGWKIAVVPNKYPAVAPDGGRSVLFSRGLYRGRTAVGVHNLVITRDHRLPFADLSPSEAFRVFFTFQRFHRDAAAQGSSAYIVSFYNYGPSAGSSVWHPHYQMLALPVVPDHIVRSLRGASRYFRRHGHCVRCDIITAERRSAVRVIEENEHAIAIAPYASQKPFEVSIMAKRHFPSLRDTSPEALRGIALLARSMARRMRTHLNDPDFNFFVHDAPLAHGEYPYHHWHLEMVPRVSIDAGFELSTGIIINVVDPDSAAAMLRGER